MENTILFKFHSYISVLMIIAVIAYSINYSELTG